jgi:hypothetical protein
MRNNEANMDMLLALLSRQDAQNAAQIKRTAASNTLTEDSALRAQSEYRQGVVDALTALIGSPAATR